MPKLYSFGHVPFKLKGKQEMYHSAAFSYANMVYITLHLLISGILYNIDFFS